MGAAAYDYDAGYACGADVGGEGEEGGVNELGEGLFFEVEGLDVGALAEETFFDR